MKLNLTQEENEIINYVESSSSKSVDNLDNEMNKYKTMANEFSNKKKPISIRILENDLYLLKQKALQTGISYQNIIQSLIHQYTHGKIKATL